MDEDEAALLAELKAISNQSAASRFEDDEVQPPLSPSVHRFQQQVDAPRRKPTAPWSTEPEEPEDEKPRKEPPRPDTLPPWKRSPRARKKSDVAADPKDTREEPLAGGSDVPRGNPSEEIIHVDEPEIIHVDEPEMKTDLTTAPSDEVGDEPSSSAKLLASDRLSTVRGVAEDAELLAELRAISSGGVDRFADDKDASAPQPPVEPNSAPNVDELQPWKRRGNPQAKAAEVVVAAPPEPAPEPTFGIKSDLPSTFQGERGGAAEDAELLAELRAISMKSSGGADRFAEEDAPVVPAVDKSEPVEPTPSPVKPASPKVEKVDKLPPWKRRGKPQAKAPDIEVVVAAPPEPAPVEEVVQSSAVAAPSVEPTFGIKSDLPSTFQGERGGAAEDAELLAELRAISMKSTGGADRFADEDAPTGATQPALEEPMEPPVVEAPVQSTSPKAEKANRLPPWKRRGKAQAKPAEVEVLVAAPPEPVKAETVEASPVEPTFGIKSDLPSTFQGERGGAAEDAELLAELRAISMKSTGGADRFAEEDASTVPVVDESESVEPKPSPVKPASPKVEKADRLPPWKRRGRAQTKVPDVEVVVAAPPEPAPVAQVVAAHSVEPTFGIKSDIPSTFQGERGGAAEDAELLAELRAISMKSSGGADRFADDDAHVAPQTAVEKPVESKVVEVPVKSTEARPRTQKADKLPPWKRRGKPPTNPVEVLVAPPPDPAPVVAAGVSSTDAKPAVEPTYGIKSDLPSTFQGERGGAAEDAELLAELRAISMQSSGGSNRFVESESRPSQDRNLSHETIQSSKNVLTESSSGPSLKLRTEPQPAVSTGVSEDDVSVPFDALPSALHSKNWKERAGAFAVLTQAISERRENSSMGHIDSDEVLRGLDELVPPLFLDSNVGALDKALELGLVYAASCESAGQPEQVTKIVESLLAKNGLSARPSTVKLGTSLVLKLMEWDCHAIEAAVSALVDVGFTSKKPKVVQNSVVLVNEAAEMFGTRRLPISILAAAMPKILSHANAKVREVALSILAELCRTLGSKTALQETIDCMKPSQVSDLDRILGEREQPFAGKVGLRRGGSDGEGGQEDALAQFKAGAKEIEAKRFASRPAVDLLREIEKTDYRAKLNLSKWSEKVGALDLVIQCGGERPFKLLQPSSSTSYAPLVSEMKKLLSHTHFAVCSKAMDVLAMLAEGVGEKLFPFLRPLLSVLFGLLKDKKLTSKAGESLDTFFGNIVGFEHIMDHDDALPSSVDERKQKNALARASTLAFLARCCERQESAGKRGALTLENAEHVAALAVSKLNDSDASVRKEAVTILKALLASGDAAVLNHMSGVVEGLKATHPRVHKGLALSDQVTAKAPSGTATEAADVSDRQLRTSLKTSLPQGGEEITKSEAAEPHRRLRKSDCTATNAVPLVAAVASVEALCIPNWSDDEDNGGVLACLECTSSHRCGSFIMVQNFLTFDFQLRSGSVVRKPFNLLRHLLTLGPL